MPYVTGAVAHGSQAGAAGGQAVAMGAAGWRNMSPKQQHPVIAVVSPKRVTSSILFMVCVSIPT